MQHSKYEVVWQHIKKENTCKVTFPADESNFRLAAQRLKKGVIKRKHLDAGFRACSSHSFILEIEIDPEARTVFFYLKVSTKEVHPCQI